MGKMKHEELEKFCKKIVSICRTVGAEPILYGSLALSKYFPRRNIEVNDADFLIKENYFEKIISLLKQERINYNYLKKWHVLQIFEKNLKIEIDSKEFWQKNLEESFEVVSLAGMKVKALSIETLEKIYLRASKVSKDNPEGNLKKYLLIKKLHEDKS